ncbi:MAG: permease [Thermoplasmata archaeon]
MKPDNPEAAKKMKKEMLRDWAILLALVAFAAVLLSIYPENRDAVAATAWDYFIELMWVLPAVMVILGLFGVFVPNEVVAKYLGKYSGAKGMVLALFIGMIPTGPLYIAFPIAASMLKKGAGVSKVIVFLSAWACIKLPQEMVELQFLGVEFMILRLSLTVVFVMAMGMLIEKIVEWREREATKGAGTD